MKNLLFNLGLATLFTHELDAVTQAEWHLLYILRDLPEKIAATTFVILHVPLFALIFWLGFNEKPNIRGEHPTFVELPSSPSPFSQDRRRGAGSKSLSLLGRGI